MDTGAVVRFVDRHVACDARKLWISPLTHRALPVPSA
jgi:hypothetical protein